MNIEKKYDQALEVIVGLSQDIQELKYKLQTNDKLFETVMKFMNDNGVTCEETIHQWDWVIENAYEFIEELFKIVEPLIEKENEDE